MRPLAWIAVCAIWGVPGCALPGPSASQQPSPKAGGGAGLPAVLVRMQKAYADLAGGKFLVLADFESKAQADLFQTFDRNGLQSEADQPSIDAVRSRTETGAGSLKAVLGRDEKLVFDDSRSSQLALVRDWRGYHVLLMSMLSAAPDCSVEISINSGEVATHWTRTVRLDSQWRLLRFDLDEIGEVADLSNVRSMSWRRLDGNRDALFLDDVVLAENERPILPERSAGKLYAFTRGARLHVGSAGRFELAFCDGKLVSWVDKDGGGNLTVASGLGPWPVALPSDWTSRASLGIDADPFASANDSMSCTQELVEATAQRCVLVGQASFQGTGDSRAGRQEDAQRPTQSNRFVIFPSGRIIVQSTLDARPAEWPGRFLGFMVTLNRKAGFRVVGADRADAGFCLYSRSGPGEADLLWSPFDAKLAGRQVEALPSDPQRIASLIGQLPAANQFDTCHLLRIWPSDLDAAADAAAVAADYQNPAALNFTRGRARTDAVGDLDHDGFNEGQGCYEIAADDGAARLILDPRGQIRFDPVLRVRGLAGRECWAYCDGRILTELGRDHDDDLLVALPGAFDRPLHIEVTSRPRP